MFNQSIIFSSSLLLAIGYGLVAVTHGKYSKNNSTDDRNGRDEYTKVFPSHRADEPTLKWPNVSSRTVDRNQPDPFQRRTPLHVWDSLEHCYIENDKFERYRYLSPTQAAECDDSCLIDQGAKNESFLMSKDARDDTRASTSPSSLASGKVYFTGSNLTNKDEVQNHSHLNSKALGSGVVDDCKQVEEASGRAATLENKTTMLCETCKQSLSCHEDKLVNLSEGDSQSNFVTELKKENLDQIDENSDKLLLEEFDMRHISHGIHNDVYIAVGNKTYHKSLSIGRDAHSTWGTGRNVFLRSRTKKLFVHPKVEGADSDYGIDLYKSIKEFMFPKSQLNITRDISRHNANNTDCDCGVDFCKLVKECISPKLHLTMIRAISRHNANKSVRNADANNFFHTLVEGTNGNSTLATNATVDNINSFFASVMTGFKAETTPAKVNITHGTVGTQMKTEDKGASVIERPEDELQANTSVLINGPMNLPSNGDVSDDKSSSVPVTTVINCETAPVEKAYLKDGNSLERVGLTGVNIETPVAKLQDKSTRTQNQNGKVKAVSNGKLTADGVNCTMGVQMTGDATGDTLRNGNTEIDRQRAGDANNNRSGKPKMTQTSSRLNPEADGNVGGLSVESDKQRAGDANNSPSGNPKMAQTSSKLNPEADGNVGGLSVETDKQRAGIVMGETNNNPAEEPEMTQANSRLISEAVGNVGRLPVKTYKSRAGIVVGDGNNNPAEKHEKSEASSRLIQETDGNVGGLPVEIGQSSTKNVLLNLFKQDKLTENREALNDNSNHATYIKPMSDLEADDIVEFLSRPKLKRNDRKSAD